MKPLTKPLLSYEISHLVCGTGDKVARQSACKGQALLSLCSLCCLGVKPERMNVNDTGIVFSKAKW